jgi:transposase
MISVEEREEARRAYFVEKKSQRQIARELQMARNTVPKAIAEAAPGAYTLRTPRPALRLGPYKARIGELLAASERMPRKQRYTGHKLFEILCQEGYQGAESSVRAYIGKRRREQRRPPLYLPLEFDPGVDAQADWGEAQVMMAGEQVTVQLFCMRLCYSRRLFMMAFPAQTQEAFFAGHVQAFAFFGGVPQRISYDNLKAAVLEVLKGHTRREQQAFIAFRIHSLFHCRCRPDVSAVQLPSRFKRALVTLCRHTH